MTLFDFLCRVDDAKVVGGSCDLFVIVPKGLLCRAEKSKFARPSAFGMLARNFKNLLIRCKIVVDRIFIRFYLQHNNTSLIQLAIISALQTQKITSGPPLPCGCIYM